EAAVAALAEVDVAALAFVLGPELALNREDVAANVNVHVVGAQAGEFRLDDDLVVGLVHVRHDGARHEAVALKGPALEHAVQHAIHLVADAHKLAYRVPTRQHKPRPPSSAFTCTSIGCVPHSIVTLGELNQKDINAA